MASGTTGRGSMTATGYNKHYLGNSKGKICFGHGWTYRNGQWGPQPSWRNIPTEIEKMYNWREPEIPGPFDEGFTVSMYINVRNFTSVYQNISVGQPRDPTQKIHWDKYFELIDDADVGNILHIGKEIDPSPVFTSKLYQYNLYERCNKCPDEGEYICNRQMPSSKRCTEYARLSTEIGRAHV